jgi:large subunit ribosomal protein L27
MPQALILMQNLAASSIEKMNEILAEAGSRYASKDPAPWIEQAKELAGN